MRKHKRPPRRIPDHLWDEWVSAYPSPPFHSFNPRRRKFMERHYFKPEGPDGLFAVSLRVFMQTHGGRHEKT